MNSDDPQEDSASVSELDTQIDSPEKQAMRAYNAAVRLLGSRDHSVFELSRKLSQREHSAEAIQSALEELVAANYINDRRYAQLYAEQRLDKGYGPLSVRAKLRTRGIDGRLIDQALAEQTVSWAELAQAALENRFDHDAISSREPSDESRIARFLNARGFSRADALKALLSARKHLIQSSS